MYIHWTASWISAQHLLVDLYHQFTSRFPTCQVYLRLPHAFRGEWVLLVDGCPQSPTLHEAPKFVRVIRRLARSVGVVPHPKIVSVNQARVKHALALTLA